MDGTERLKIREQAGSEGGLEKLQRVSTRDRENEREDDQECVT